MIWTPKDNTFSSIDTLQGNRGGVDGLQLKNEKDVIGHVHQGMTILEVSQMYSISRQTIENWLKNTDKYLIENRTGLKPFDIEEKF